MSIRLSPHFSLDEFLRSDTAARLGQQILASEWVQDNLQALCRNILEPIREVFGPLVVTSGYRPGWLNTHIGGSRNSDHMTGCAVDLISPTTRPLDLARAVSVMDLPFKQLILEFGQWTHISFDPMIGAEPKRQMLTAHMVGGRVEYEAGIVEV